MKSEFLSILLMFVLTALVVSRIVSQISPMPPTPLMSGANAI